MNSLPHLCQRFVFSVMRNASDSWALFLIDDLVNVLELSESHFRNKGILFIYFLSVPDVLKNGCIDLT